MRRARFNSKLIFFGRPLGLGWLRCGWRRFLSGEREADIAGIAAHYGVRVNMGFRIAFAVGLNAPASDFHPFAKFPDPAGTPQMGRPRGMRQAACRGGHVVVVVDIGHEARLAGLRMGGKIILRHLLVQLVVINRVVLVVFVPEVNAQPFVESRR
jgi:hypothetical protein